MVRAHQSPRQKRFYIILILADDNILISFICLVQPEPYPPKIDFLQKAFTNVLPCRMTTTSTGGAESRPVTVIEKDLQAAFLGKLARLDVEDDDSRLCDRDLLKDIREQLPPTMSKELVL